MPDPTMRDAKLLARRWVRRARKAGYADGDILRLAAAEAPRGDLLLRLIRGHLAVAAAARERMGKRAAARRRVARLGGA